MSRYSKEHYEDVARILSSAYEWNGCRSDYPAQYKDAAKLIIRDFADLFAADNPPGPRCWHCGDSQETIASLSTMCTRPNEGHNFGGFDRERFLTACGLATESVVKGDS